MKIADWDIADAARLAPAYSKQLAGIPHCYAVSPEEFEAGFPYKRYADESYCEDIHSEKLIVGEQDGKIVGFADVAVAEMEENGKKESVGFIRFLTYQPGCRPVGQAILEEAERHLLDLGKKQIKAFRLNFRNDHCGYRFYHLKYCMVSDRMGHVCALFDMNGYEKNGGEIFMNWPDYSIAEPVLPDGQIEIVIQQKPPERAELPRLAVKVFRDGREIGICESASAGERCQANEAQDWVFITWLDVKAGEQGKGLGRYLLQRNLWEMRKTGYKNTVISADWENYRAHLFYMNYGYRLVDNTYELVKSR